MNIHDLTALCMPAAPRLRRIGRIDSIIMHRIKVGRDALAVAEWFLAHPEEGIPSMPYHFFIRLDGGIDHARLLDHTTPHAYKWNSRAVGVAVDGDFRTDKLTPQQQTAVLWLLPRLVCAIPDKRLAIWGHDENADASTHLGHVCPGANFDMRQLRAEVSEMVSLTAIEELRHAGAQIW